MRRIFAFFICLMLGGALWIWGGSGAAAGEEPSVILGEEEVVFDWSSDKCAKIDIPDTPARAFVDGMGKVQLIASHYKNWRLVGDSLDNLSRDCEPVLESHRNGDPSKFDDREWIHSLFYDDKGTEDPNDDVIYALIHNEYHGSEHGYKGTDWTKSWYNAITFAASEDMGKTYSHPQPPQHLVACSPFKYYCHDGPYGIFNPSNIIYNPRDGYYYCLVHLERPDSDWGGVGIMRTRDLSDPTSWRGWDGEGFNVKFVNPYTYEFTDTDTPAEHLLARISYHNIGKMCDSITYNTYFGKFLLIGARPNGDPPGFYYALSDDLIHWTKSELLWDCETWWEDDPGADKCGYPSLIDPDSPSIGESLGDPAGGRNFAYSDQEAFLYYTVWHDSTSTENYLYDRDLVRRRITFKKHLMMGIDAYPNPTDTNHEIQFFCTVAGGKPPYSFSWDFNSDGIVDSTEQNPTFKYDSDGFYTVKCTVTDSEGNTKTESMSIFVNPPLSIELEVNPNPTEAGCETSVIARASGGIPYDGSTPRLSPYKYSWKVGEWTISQRSEISVGFEEPGTYTVSCTITDRKGSKATGEVEIEVRPPLSIVNLTASPNPAEVGEEITFSFEVSGGAPPFIYCWQFGDGAAFRSEEVEFPAHVYTSPGEYAVKLIVESSCNQDIKTLTVNIKPICGDVNLDNEVNCEDLALIARSFNTSPPLNPSADLNEDGIVDILDLVSGGKNFGRAFHPD